MQTQIQCPQCRQPVPANVEQLIDVDKVPQMKQMLMNGQLNVAQCRNCGWAGQVSVPLVYHDGAHDLLMTFVPMEANIPYAEQERMMGQLVRRIVDGVPMEKRRAYLLQPKNIVRWQTFIENVLETEGITKEMIARQRKQMELLQTLIKADQDVVNYLVTERASEIDETFVTMVNQTLQQASQAGAPEAINLSNLLSKLMRETPAGKNVEKRQLALHALQLEAKANEGVSSEMLANHIAKNRDDDGVIDAILEAVGGLTYEFFTSFTAKIDAAAQAGDKPQVDRLTEIRTRLLAIYDKMVEASAKRMQEAVKVVDALVAAPDKAAAIQQIAEQIDEGFLMVLERETAKAQEEGNLERSVALREVRKHLEDMVRTSGVPEMQLITMLMRARSPQEMSQMLEANAPLVSDQLLTVLEQLAGEVNAAEQPDVAAHLQRIRVAIGERLIG